jgi:hypothetical protein
MKINIDRHGPRFIPNTCRNLLFSSVADKQLTKILNNFFGLLLFEGTFTDKKSKLSHKKGEIKIFLTFFSC